MPYREIVAAAEDGIAVVTLNRPDQLNAWTERMRLEVRHAIAEFDSRDDVRVIVVTGAGRAFCVGADLSDGGIDFELTDVDELRPKTERPYWEMATPIIAAMNGSAVGIGVALPMQCDLRIVAEDAKYGFVYSRRGYGPELGATWFLPRLIGTARAMDVLLTGRIFSGTEAAAMGFANEALPAVEVLGRALELARDIADNVAPVSAAVMKRLIHRHLVDDDPEAAVQRERELFASLSRLDDAREGATAFMEKRTPRWTMSKYDDFPSEAFED